MVHLEINAGGTNQLRNDNTLGAVDDKGAGVGHQREVAHEHVTFLDLTRFFIQQARGYAQRRGIGGVSFLTFDNRIVGMIDVEGIVDKVQYKVVLIIIDTGNILEDLFETLVQEPLIGFLLDFDKIRHIDDVFDFAEALTLRSAQFNVFDINQKRITPSFCYSREHF